MQVCQRGPRDGGIDGRGGGAFQPAERDDQDDPGPAVKRRADDPRAEPGPALGSIQSPRMGLRPSGAPGRRPCSHRIPVADFHPHRRALTPPAGLSWPLYVTSLLQRGKRSNRRSLDDGQTRRDFDNPLHAKPGLCQQGREFIRCAFLSVGGHEHVQV